MTMNHLTWVPRPIAAEALDQLREVGDVAIGYGPDAVSYSSVADRVTGVLLRTAEFRRTDIDAAPRLRIIARHGVGVDTVDVSAATERGIPVTVTGEANAQSVAEQVFALLLAVARKVTAADAVVRDGRWGSERAALVGHELSGRRLGLLGCGRIGRRVARIGKAFGMQVAVCDPNLSNSEADRIGARLLPRTDLLAASDVLSLHVPLTEETRHIIDRDALDAMPAGAILINTSRGGLIDEAALLDASTDLLGAGLDVTAHEPLSDAGELTSAPNIVFSPHIGGQTHEAMRKVALDAAASVCRAYRGVALTDVVNKPTS